MTMGYVFPGIWSSKYQCLEQDSSAGQDLLEGQRKSRTLCKELLSLGFWPPGRDEHLKLFLSRTETFFDIQS